MLDDADLVVEVRLATDQPQRTRDGRGVPEEDLDPELVRDGERIDAGLDLVDTLLEDVLEVARLEDLPSPQATNCDRMCGAAGGELVDAGGELSDVGLGLGLLRREGFDRLLHSIELTVEAELEL